jgi:hypothetical protein
MKKFSLKKNVDNSFKNQNLSSVRKLVYSLAKDSFMYLTVSSVRNSIKNSDMNSDRRLDWDLFLDLVRSSIIDSIDDDLITNSERKTNEKA